MPEKEPPGPGGTEPAGLLTPEQERQAQLDRIEAQLERIEKLVMEIRDAVAVTGRQLGHD